jgi:hypothetical protein
LFAGGLLVLSLGVPAGAHAQCATYPNTLTNGTTADATQVMANFNCAALTGAAHFTGNVGIGTTTPGTNLDIETNTTYAVIRLGAAQAPAIEYYSSSQGADQKWWDEFDNGTTFAFRAVNDAYTAATAWMEVIRGTGYTIGSVDFPSSYVGIGTTTPTYELYVNGTAYATGAAGALSDIRHKKNVERLAPGALGIVGQLRPVTFDWREPKDDGMKGPQIGFIAQDVQKVLPQVVLTENNAEKTLGLKYDEIIPVLTAAIQEQQAEIAALKTRLAALQARVDQASPSH